MILTETKARPESPNPAGLFAPDRKSLFLQINDVPMEPVLDARYKHRYWNIAKQKGYGALRDLSFTAKEWPTGCCFLSLAGTAVFSKHKPISVTCDLPDITTPDVVKGRLVILEFESCFVVGTYVPNAGQKLKVRGLLNFLK